MKKQTSQKEPKKQLMFPVAPPFDVVYKKESAPYPVGPHAHNAVELYYTLTALPDVLLNDKIFAVPAGTLLIIPTFCVHQLYHEIGTIYERYILSINTEWLDQVLCEGAIHFSFLKDSTNPLFLLPPNPKLVHHFDTLLSHTDRTTPAAMADLFCFLSDLKEMTKELSLKQKQMLPVSASQGKVNEILEYLQDHITETITISDLANHFYLNPDYLARLFKKHMHISLGHYITLQKISVAESLLREGKSVAQVQEILGYSSYSYFFKSFQKITGISPSQYGSQYKNR